MSTIGIDYGLTPTGFKAKRLADIVADLKARMQQIVDPVTGESPQIDENDGSFLSQILGISAEPISLCWQAVEAVALQFDPLFNVRAGQSGTVQLNGILRIAGYPEVKTIALTGIPATVIPIGSIIATSNGNYQFTLNDEIILDEDGNATTSATCTIDGPTGLETGDVNAILTPVSGWSTAVDTATPIIGKDEETDAELRLRQQRSTAYVAGRHVEAIYDAVYNVEGVTYCRVYQNNTISIDGRDIPAKSIAVVVVGGIDIDIAEAIFSKSPIGVGFDGNLTSPVVIIDAQGETYEIDFWRPEPIEIDIEVKVHQTDASFPSTAAADIKQAILNYTRYGAMAVGAGENFDRNGFPPGETVVLTQLYTPINSIPGHKVTSLKIAVHGETLGTDDIDIDWNEAAQFSAENIAVTIE